MNEIEFTVLIGNIGLEALFQMSRPNPHLIQTNRDRRDFAAGQMQLFARPGQIICWLQMGIAIGLLTARPVSAGNGKRSVYDR